VPEATAAHVISQHFMPVLCIRGRPEIRLGSFQSLGGATLAGPWSPVAVGPDKAVAGTAEAAPTADVMPVEAFEAQATTEAENELDALLAGLNAPGDTAAAEAAAPASGEPEAPPAGGTEDDLDALLAGLGGSEETAGEADLDPDLAALLGAL
jgi:hypothetical protein